MNAALLAALRPLREYLASLLARHAGNFTRAAAAAGIDRMYFKRLVRRYDLDP